MEGTGGGTQEEGRRADGDVDSSDDDEDLFYSGTDDPVIDEESESESQRIFKEVDLQYQSQVPNSASNCRKKAVRGNRRQELVNQNEQGCREIP
jgi:hypothetical protein